jgi:hypothetical protein
MLRDRFRAVQATPLVEMYESRRAARSGNVQEAQKDTLRLLMKGVESGDIKVGENITLDDLIEVFVWPAVQERGIPFDPRTGDFSEIREEITSTQFLYATSKLVNPAMIEAYELQLGDVMSLVRETESALRREDYVGTTDGDAAQYVPEGFPYPEVGIDEKRVSIDNFKFGKLANVTAEMLKFDQTSKLVDRAQDAGQRLADIIEEFIVNRVTDTAWSEINEATSQAYVVNGTRRALYANDNSAIDSQTNDTLAAAAVIGVGQIKAMWNLLKAMTTEKGRPMTVRPTTIFASSQMEIDIAQFFQMQETDLDNSNGISGNKNPFRGKFRTVTSAYTPTATEYYIGDFQRQFTLQWVWKPQLRVDRAGEPRRDVVGGFSASAYLGIGAREHRFVVKSAGA